MGALVLPVTPVRANDEGMSKCPKCKRLWGESYEFPTPDNGEQRVCLSCYSQALFLVTLRDKKKCPWHNSHLPGCRLSFTNKFTSPQTPCFVCNRTFEAHEWLAECKAHPHSTMRICTSCLPKLKEETVMINDSRQEENIHNDPNGSIQEPLIACAICHKTWASVPYYPSSEPSESTRPHTCIICHSGPWAMTKYFREKITEIGRSNTNECLKAIGLNGSRRCFQFKTWDPEDYKCDICFKKRKSKLPRYGNKQDNTDYCWSCMPPNIIDIGEREWERCVCSLPWALSFDNTASDRCICDACGDTFPADVGHYRCDKCDHDLCVNCKPPEKPHFREEELNEQFVFPANYLKIFQKVFFSSTDEKPHPPLT